MIQLNKKDSNLESIKGQGVAILQRLRLIDQNSKVLSKFWTSRPCFESCSTPNTTHSNTLISKFPFVFTLVFVFLTSIRLSGQIHSDPACYLQSSFFNLDFSTSPSGPDQFDWTGSGTQLSNVFSNVDNSGLDVTIVFSGATSSLAPWGSTGNNYVDVGTNPSGGVKDVLEFYTTGFGSPGTVTIDILFSQPVSAVAFDLYDINGAGPTGDNITINGMTGLGATINPTLTASPTPSYTIATNVINSNNNSTTGTNDQVGVNFASPDSIVSIKIIWDECTACTPGTAHGAGLDDLKICFVQEVDISGNIYHDCDGLGNSTVDGVGIGQPESTQLYVSLIDTSSNTVFAATSVNADGTYG